MAAPRSLILVFAVLATGACSTPEIDPNIADPLGRCVYLNSFSDDLECKEYYGSDWTPDEIEADCRVPVPGSDAGTVDYDIGCDREAVLGECVIDEGTVEAAIIVFWGDDPESCSGLAVGCSFAGGEYRPAPLCGGDDVPPPADYVPFTPLEQICLEPLPGEPDGRGPDGEVCTWEAISASTEEGRRYTDYASCEPVYTQRPYWASAVEANTPDDDPRYDDKAWATEIDWVTAQVEASACVCCHSADVAPSGPSGWYLEAPGIWIDTLDDDATAMLAGWIDSTAFGAFDPDENNGFARDETGMPSTNPARMKAFWEGELARRGLTEQDFVDHEPFGGPMADQLAYEPSACASGSGVGADGRVTWAGGPARYVYVLDAGSANPGVPPNLDLPDGTRWRIDVAPEGTPVSSGIAYGDAPGGSTRRFPDSGPAAPLESGRDYYLVALFDVGQPLTRCIFEAE